MRQLFLDTIVNAHSLGASFSSSSKLLDYVELYSAQLIWTDGGSLSGSVALQVSNDGTNWSTLDSHSLTGSSTFMFNKSDTFYRYLRFNYTRTAGTGSLTILLNGKGASSVQA